MKIKQLNNQLTTGEMLTCTLTLMDKGTCTTNPTNNQWYEQVFHACVYTREDVMCPPNYRILGTGINWHGFDCCFIGRIFWSEIWHPLYASHDCIVFINNRKKNISRKYKTMQKLIHEHLLLGRRWDSNKPIEET